MSPVSLRLLIVALFSLGVAACATAPIDNRPRILAIPLASAHANFAFTLFTGTRQKLSCDDATSCPVASEQDAARRFAHQVQRVATALQAGAQALYPDLAERVPEMAGGRFDVFVVDAAEPASDSSANGRIALNSGLASHEPYDEWLAFVIAREMGHVIAHHHEENSAASIATSVIMNILIPGSSLLKSALSAGGAGIAARSKRDVQMREADAIARQLLAAADFVARDVSLSLRLATALPDEGLWPNDFRASAADFLAEVGNSEPAVASIMWDNKVWQGAALAPDY